MQSMMKLKLRFERMVRRTGSQYAICVMVVTSSLESRSSIVLLMPCSLMRSSLVSSGVASVPKRFSVKRRISEMSSVSGKAPSPNATNGATSSLTIAENAYPIGTAIKMRSTPHIRSAGEKSRRRDLPM